MFAVKIDNVAKKKLSKLPKKIKKQIKDKIDDLAEEPRPDDSSHLKSDRSKRYIRSGNYRIIYKIEDKEVLVLVLAIGDRKDVYKRFGRR